MTWQLLGALGIPTAGRNWFDKNLLPSLEEEYSLEEIKGALETLTITATDRHGYLYGYEFCALLRFEIRGNEFVYIIDVCSTRPEIKEKQVNGEVVFQQDSQWKDGWMQEEDFSRP